MLILLHNNECVGLKANKSSIIYYLSLILFIYCLSIYLFIFYYFHLALTCWEKLIINVKFSIAFKPNFILQSGSFMLPEDHFWPNSTFLWPSPGPLRRRIIMFMNKFQSWAFACPSVQPPYFLGAQVCALYSDFVWARCTEHLSK